MEALNDAILVFSEHEKRKMGFSRFFIIND